MKARLVGLMVGVGLAMSAHARAQVTLENDRVPHAKVLACLRSNPSNPADCIQDQLPPPPPPPPGAAPVRPSTFDCSFVAAGNGAPYSGANTPQISGEACKAVCNARKAEYCSANPAQKPTMMCSSIGFDRQGSGGSWLSENSVDCAVENKRNEPKAAKPSPKPPRIPQIPARPRASAEGSNVTRFAATAAVAARGAGSSVKTGAGAAGIKRD